MVDSETLAVAEDSVAASVASVLLGYSLVELPPVASADVTLLSSEDEEVEVAS